MYTEEYERRGFPFRDFILKLILIIIFVFLLIWLLPKFLVPSIVKQINESNNNNGIVCKTGKCDTSGIDALTSQIFSDNIEKMKDAAISYYTDERLPQEVGESDTMTLSDMIGKKIIVPLVDKNNKACDVEKSYVKITKFDDEYILKVNLKDSEKEDYILVHLGCYTYCDSYLCQKESSSIPTKGSKATEYVPIKGYIDRGTYYPPENPTPVIIRRYCVKYDGNYYGNSGVVVSYNEYLKQCTTPTPEKKYYCEKHDNKYYDKNGNVVSYEEYVKQCSTPTPEDKHYCEKYGDNYYDDNGNVVSYEEYINKCTTPPTPEDKHYCEYYKGKYYDKNGNVVSYEEYDKQCGVPHYCEYYNGKYYDKNGKIVSKDEYKKSCEEEIEYLYEYTKTTNTKFSEWTKWGSWEQTNCNTEEVNCNDSNPSCLFKLQRFNRQEVVGTYKKSYTVTRDVVRQTGSYEVKACSKYNYYKIDNITYATVISKNYERFIELARGSSVCSDCRFVGRIAVDNPLAQETLTHRYVFVGIDDSLCGVDTCTTFPKFIYDEYEYVGGLTRVNSTEHVIGYSESPETMTSTEFQATCGEYTYKTIPIYSTIRVTEGARRDEPLYGTVCYQSTKSRTIIEKGKTQTTWSTYNDSSLLNDGWTYTGNKKRK